LQQTLIHSHNNQRGFTMAKTSVLQTSHHSAGGAHILASDAVEQAFRVLHTGFVVAPIVAGLDKFFNLLTDWSQYVPGVVGQTIDPGVMLPVVGIVEIGAGLLVLFNPRIGGMVVALWLVLIIAGLLAIPGYFDVALRDLGLALGAIALSRLAASRDARYV
jgi:uncharacterized membrane protein YphA (DoxX/SURF4 family)